MRQWEEGLCYVKASLSVGGNGWMGVGLVTGLVGDDANVPSGAV